MTINVTPLILSIAAVESGGNPLAVGKAGELSAFQISPAVWAQHAKSDEPFALASHPDGVLAAHIAEAHVVWLTRQLEAAGVPVTVENLANGWHLGATGAIRRALRGAEQSPTSYSARVANGYAAALAAQPSRAPEHLRDVLPPPPQHP